MILYFSGTGNSRFAAQFLAHRLQDEMVDVTKQIQSGTKGAFHSERPWIFVTPTYGWQIPHVFEDYIRKSDFSGSHESYFVLTCGSEIGNAGKYAARLCAEKKMEYCGILEVVMPENYIAMFSVPNHDEAIRIIEKAKPVLQQGAELIQEKKHFPIPHISAADQLKSGIVNTLFYRLFVKADAFYAKENCIGCGKCVNACPLNNIKLVDKRPVWGKSCTHCMACICGCPAEAIEYGKKSRGKPRYQCPEYKA